MLVLPGRLGEKPTTEVKGIGPVRAGRLAALGIHTVSDLLLQVPFRYEDWRPTHDYAKVADQDTAAVGGQVRSVKVLRGRPPRTWVRLKGQSGEARALIFGRRWLGKRLSRNQQVILRGQWVKKESGVIECIGAEIDVNAEGNIKAVYSAGEGVSSGQIARFVHSALKEFYDSLPEPLPLKMRRAYDVLSLRRALHSIHLPADAAEVRRGRRSLMFLELLLFYLGLGRSHLNWLSAGGISHRGSDGVSRTFLRRLPFELTGAQRRCIKEIRVDLKSNAPMCRLLQGEVGSGKTVVAGWATARALDCERQAVWLAPTRLLAEQHYRTLRRWFPERKDRVYLLTNEADSIPGTLSREKFDIIVGTHSLFYKKDEFDRFSLLVIDEQHKFGVEQRAILQQVKPRPDVLMLSATPIPRTMARAVYGRFPVSTIDELPAGRKRVTTKFVSGADRKRVYQFLRSVIEKKRGAYVVCPTIDPTERSAKECSGVLQWGKKVSEMLPKAEVALLHGRTPGESRRGILQGFREGEIDVIVGTTVIEVGLDQPRASVIVVEEADRFGLSELHQLRGRVGRSNRRAWCFLISDSDNSGVQKRLRFLERTDDGFEISLYDMKRRGFGDFFASVQHGMPPFLFPNSFQRTDLRKSAARAAEQLLQGNASLNGSELFAMLKSMFADRLHMAEIF